MYYLINLSSSPRLYICIRFYLLPLSMPQGQSDLVYCRCRSYCTRWNHVSRQYEGPGQVISRRTRDNHVRDDRTAAAMHQNRQLPLPMALPLNNPPQDLPHPHALLISEIDSIMELPFTHPNRPLVFLHDPSENGEFIWPTDDEITIPNRGPHALLNHRNNKYYLFVEHRLCSILRDLQLLPGDADNQALNLRVDAELRNLVQQKCVEWSEQRGNGGPGRPFVNTGTSHLYLKSLLFTFD